MWFAMYITWKISTCKITLFCIGSLEIEKLNIKIIRPSFYEKMFCLTIMMYTRSLSLETCFSNSSAEGGNSLCAWLLQIHFVTGGELGPKLWNAIPRDISFRMAFK